MRGAGPDSFGAATTLRVDGVDHTIHAVDAVPGSTTLPFSLKVLLENLLRSEDGVHVTAEHIRRLGDWDPSAEPHTEIPFTPARVLTQDLSGGPAIIDLVAMRGIVQEWGGDAEAINPLAPVELVVDHSVIVDVAGRSDAFERNVDLEYARNRERYTLLRWAQAAFDNLAIVPPGTGIVHQVNIEHLARVVFSDPTADGRRELYPDTCVGTDSHTPMVNGLGVLGWGVGGIEAEAAMLGQPISMLIPRVVGFELTGTIPPGSTATDVVLTITEMLRAHGVVGSFVEFYGDGVAAVPVANRATIGNMSPEFGATAAMFPIDEATLDYLRLTGRDEDHVRLVEAYARRQGMWLDADTPEPRFSDRLALDLSTVVPSIAGPRRPHDRIEVSRAKAQFALDLPEYASGDDGRATLDIDGREVEVRDGMLAIAAITSCTNTSNPALMLAAAMLARGAVKRGLSVPPWVRTSMAPGSKVVTGYFERAGLWPYLEKLGFHLVGYGCTTCMGNSGPIHEAVSRAVEERSLVTTSVLSGNRNFEGRIHPDVAMNYLASPPLVVAYALAGTVDIDFATEPLGTGADGAAVFLRDIWPTPDAVEEVIGAAVSRDLFRRDYADVFAGDERWRALPTPTGSTFSWDEDSSYVRRPPYFDGITREVTPVSDIVGARVLVRLGDSVNTDQISPAGAIGADSAAGRYLAGLGVQRRDVNSYGARRGNHEVMVRGTFAAVRILNLLLDGVEGGFTRDFSRDGGPQTTVFEAAQSYAAEGRPSIVLAGAEYGIGSSRDWAAKGPRLLGVRAVIAESFERIHRSNLIGMGILPLQYRDGESTESLGLDGTETFDVTGIEELNTGSTPDTVRVDAVAADGTVTSFHARVRLDTPAEADYYRHDGILPYVMRRLVDDAMLREEGRPIRWAGSSVPGDR